jgi:chromosome segregation ATPase
LLFEEYSDALRVNSSDFMSVTVEGNLVSRSGALTGGYIDTNHLAVVEYVSLRSCHWQSKRRRPRWRAHLSPSTLQRKKAVIAREIGELEAQVAQLIEEGSALQQKVRPSVARCYSCHLFFHMPVPS